MTTINLNREAYPFVRTSTGDKLMVLLHVNMKRVQFGVVSEMKRYAYCMACGAARENNVEFNYVSVDEFIKACPPEWMAVVRQLLDESVDVSIIENDKDIEAGEVEAPEDDEEEKAIEETKEV
jgi:hypothetical protein